MSRRARARETARESKHSDFFSRFGPPEGDEDDEGGIDVEPEHCACFPGCCRGGEVIGGRLANGVRCKACIPAEGWPHG